MHILQSPKKLDVRSMCLGPVVFLHPDFTLPITQEWVRQVPLGSRMTTLGTG